MIRSIFALLLVNFAHALTFEQLSSRLDICWRHLNAGVAKAEKYQNCFAPNAKFLLNGSEDPAQWGNLEFLQEYLKLVSIERPKLLMPPIELRPNVVSVPVESTVVIVSTREKLPLGHQNYQVTFNDEGKIIEQSVVGDSKPLERLSEMLTPPDFELRTQLMAFLNAMKAKASLNNFLITDFAFTRNGVTDTADWTDEKFQEVLFREWNFLDTQILAFGTSGMRSCSLQLRWTIQDTKINENLVFVEGWDVLFGIDGKINTIQSTVDNQAIFALYAPLRDTLLEQHKKREEAKRPMQQQGQAQAS